MKPTTTLVFVSPVRPQINQSRLIQGLFESVAGAHKSCLLAAQEGQAKSLPKMVGGSPGIFSGCRLFLLVLMTLLACQIAHAGIATPEKTPPVQLDDPYYEQKIYQQKMHRLSPQDNAEIASHLLDDPSLQQQLKQNAAEIDKAQKPTAQIPLTKPKVTTVTGSASLAQAKKPRKNRVSTSNSTQNVIPPVQANADSQAAQTPLPETISATQETAPPVQAIDPCNTSDPNATPAMVAIRPGRFTMGSPETEQGRQSDESPQHRVTLPKPFAISRCEITVGQFKQFIQESGYKTTAETDSKGCYVWNVEKKDWQLQADKHWKNTGFAQSDQRPVVCMSWSDAQRYVDWLSQRTGAVYRLPTEAEWEYAARADTDTARYFGTKSQCEYANGLGQEAKSIADKNWTLAECNDGYIFTAPVAHYKPNLFGLYDMLGNANEWTLDCWHEDYKLAPYDGMAWLETQNGTCDHRVIRSGTWLSNPLYLRSAKRFREFTDATFNDLGFRIARAL